MYWTRKVLFTLCKWEKVTMHRGIVLTFFFLCLDFLSEILNAGLKEDRMSTISLILSTFQTKARLCLPFVCHASCCNGFKFYFLLTFADCAQYCREQNPEVAFLHCFHFDSDCIFVQMEWDCGYIH